MLFFLSHFESSCSSPALSLSKVPALSKAEETTCVSVCLFSFESIFNSCFVREDSTLISFLYQHLRIFLRARTSKFAHCLCLSAHCLSLFVYGLSTSMYGFNIDCGRQSRRKLRQNIQNEPNYKRCQGAAAKSDKSARYPLNAHKRRGQS